MDTPSHFFSDSLDLEDPSPYPGTTGREDGDDVDDFQLFGNNMPYGFAVPGTRRPEDARSTIWGDGDIDPTALFVDPSLYGEQEGGALKIEPGTVEPEITVAPAGLAPPSPSPSTRRTSSSKASSRRASKSAASASTALTPPEQEPPRKRIASKSRKLSTEIKLEEESTDKRKQFLERNRRAATKCREKKKKYVKDMEDTKSKLEDENHHLLGQRDALVAEVQSVKLLLMSHAGCEDPSIDNWIKTEATRAVPSHPEDLCHAYPSYGASLSSPLSTGMAYQASELDGLSLADRRASTTYSHASSLQTSPTEAGFPSAGSPQFSPQVSPQFKVESGDDPEVNLDHMPDYLFNKSDQPPALKVD